MKFETAAVIIPNNNFLTGDLNIANDIKIIAGTLKAIGYNLKKISVVDENDRSVAYELTLFSKLYDVVLILTNTRQDFVSQALTNITSQELILQTELNEATCDKTNGLMWPECTKLLKSTNNIYPVIYFQRIFILKLGVVEEQFTFILKEHLRHYRKESIYSKIFNIPSNGFKNFNNLVQNDNITINFEKHNENGSEKNILKVSSNNFESIVKAEMVIREKLGLHIINLSWVHTLCDMVYGSPDKHIKFAIETIEACLEEYGLENIFLSFNGGKDCTVLLHLVQTVLEKKYPNQKNSTKMFCLYVRNENAFKEQDEFIDQCRIFFNLEVAVITSNIKDALSLTLEQNPNFKACFMGTRRTDPYSLNLNTFEMTDPEWPQIMRCSPLLDWHYSDIWDYLLYYKVPYCKLYDYGYTSLGNATNTIRNQSLIIIDDNEEMYLPAYKMLNEKKERIGRNISKI